MNTWIVKLGIDHFSKDDITKVRNFASKQLPNYSSNLFEYKTDHIHYLSIPIKSDTDKVNHHYSNGYLLGYSGLITANRTSSQNLRSATQINAQIDRLTDIFEFAEGSFSLFKISESGFECIVDCLATSKVYYFKHLNGDVYVSNHPKLLKLFKAFNPNVQFYINYIASSRTNGTSTDDLDISTLPEFGRLRWTPETSLKIDSYKDLSEIIKPREDFDFLLKETISQLKETANYLTTFHKAVISLSAGFDSRIAINMFWNSNKKNVQAYTFPDHSIDTMLAIKLAKDHGISHQLLNPSDFPDVDTLHKYLEKDHAPFFNYNNVFGYLFEKEISSILEPDNSVLLTGLGGDTELGIKQFSKIDDFENKEPVAALLDFFIKSKYLTDEGYNNTRSNLKEYLLSKYSEYLHTETPLSRLSNIYYLLERFGGYQAQKNHLSAINKFDYYLPYGNLRFLQTSFASSLDKLMRHKKNSIHHQMSMELVGKSSKPIRFTKNLHWEAGKIEKLKKVSRNKLNKYLPSSGSSKQKKNSDILREKFFNENIDHYKEVVFSYDQSLLWDYLDKHYVQSLFNEKGSIYKQHSNLISKVVPLLKNSI
jgi:hypothetical protein